MGKREFPRRKRKFPQWKPKLPQQETESFLNGKPKLPQQQTKVSLTGTFVSSNGALPFLQRDETLPLTVIYHSYNIILRHCFRRKYAAPQDGTVVTER